MESGEVLTPEGDFYGFHSIKSYKRCVTELKAFESEFGRIYVSDINIIWGDSFKIFLIKKGLAKNTISIRLSSLKAIMKRLYNQGHSKFSGAGIRTGLEITTTVYNTIEELKKIYNYDLSMVPGLERVRDIYVFHCFIGLRFADLKAVLLDVSKYIRNESDRLFLEVKTQKTGEVAIIPMASIVKDILEKRKNDFGSKFSYQYYNKAIKQLGNYLNINNKIIHSITKGGQRVDTTKLKYDMMSSHTARRSFATNAYLAGVPIMAIMKITGHKTVNSFMRYIRCSSMESAINISDHPFFDQKI